MCPSGALILRRSLGARPATPARVLLFHPLPVRAAGHFLSPFVVFKVPEDRLPDSALEGFPRMQLYFALDLVSINGIASVVSGTILHECDQVTVWNNRILG